MHQNIKNNYTKNIDAKLFSANYYDYMLYMGEESRLSKNELDDMAIADFSDLYIVSGMLYSTVTWKDAVNNGAELEDIGLTGMDNGLIAFQKDRITNKEFLELYLNSKYVIESGDTRLFLSPVMGNSQMFSYPMEVVEANGEKYAAFKGGFYQGYFKLNGFDYQVLPDKIDDEFLFHFDIRPRSDYNTEIDTVNYVHPENEGMFFFMGTRAENKFWPFYKFNEEKMKSLQKVNAVTEGYFECSGESSYNINKNEVVNADWLEYEPISEKNPCDRYHFLDGDYFAEGDRYYIDINDENINFPILHGCSTTTTEQPSVNYLNTYNFKPESFCGCSKETPLEDIDTDCIRCSTEYFNDGYYDNRCANNNGKMAEDKYIGEDVKINKGGYEDSDGHAPNKHGYYDIITDNQFVMFDRTCNGITTKNYHSGMTVTLQGRQSWPNANYFVLMNRTCNGYTTKTIANYNEDNAYDYNLYKDIRNNVFGLRITKEGAIGYRYGILDCDEENPDRYKVIEEYSKKGIVKSDQWNSINVRFAVINPSNGDKCGKFIKKMRIMFYVNGFLVFISKEIDSIVFKALDDVYQKQEGVPYSISLGGGSLGLLETVLPDYYAISDYILPIERDFCGTFLGDIKSFKIYKGFVDYSAITDYLSKNNMD